MLAYPQLASGALAQFPIRKLRRTRTVVNTLADMTSIKLGDPEGGLIEWRLEYSGLSDEEVSVLEQFFEATEGSLQAFTFLDPTANLFPWSGQLDNPEWSLGPFLSIEGGIADPLGGTGGWRLTNSGAGPQGISQTLSAPGGYLYCLSAYGRSAQPATVTLLCGGDRAERIVGTNWDRITFSSHGDASAESVAFGIEVPAGTSVEVFGLQAEPQAGASAYKTSTTGGVYENAHFRDDVLPTTSTDVNRHSATVNIIHANRL